ncbi:hypothetical protein FN846DRAFT_895270 [Sphaerosporella brunnea]|uniref:Uncharacterized protein n=1 Tax=Sphaerosporella brunnea TaxID=1250544 RepID=A0A5J5EFW1_9PEZI|nr:hypothetical protein FN846DRAFT_895270 [Sphaerosporella brunnea]
MPETPLSIRNLKRVCREIMLDAAALDTPPSFQHKLKAGHKGGLVQSQAGARAFADLVATKAAEKSRQQRSRSSLQKGGVLYAENARNMVKRREEEEVKKAEAALCRAQTAQKRAQKAAHKPFLDAVKKKQKEIKARYSKRTRNWTPVPKREMEWKVIMSELRMVARAGWREKRPRGVYPLW